MTQRQISRVHGLSIPELEVMLHKSCRLIDDSVKLESDILGGWSNINIRGKSSELDFVLKLPWPLKPDPSYYDYLHASSSFFGKLGIAVSPLAKGALSNGLPYIIFEYLEGTTYEEIGELSEQEAKLLNQALHRLHSEKPPNLQSHYSPLDYLLTSRSMVESHEGLSKCSEELANLIHSFNELEEPILEYAELLGSWSMSVMHGDLWIPNVVFQSERAYLLDFENCAYGEDNYDLAYFLESPVEPIEAPPAILEGYDEERIEELRLVALGWIIWWSLERLLSMESDLIEPNLNTDRSWQAVMDYTNLKIDRLRDMLS